MGARRSAAAARVILSRLRPRILVCFGVAGAPGRDLRVGDVVVATTVHSLERGALAGPLALLQPSPAATGAAEAVLHARGARLYTGTAVTTQGGQILPPAARVLLRPVLEMETAGIARVALEQGIPLLCVRAISDSADDPLPFDLEHVLDGNQRIRGGRLLAALIAHPPRIAAALRAGQNATHAAHNLTVALIAMLEREFTAAAAP